ncbi:MAG: UPF0323 family lipoprotein [Sulfurospirillaceae bacterium]|nr:UPF0323 family lipoprotein [Sulfurospirillaceae bacterium]
MGYIRKISEYAIAGGLSVFVIAGMQGCDSKQDDKNALEEAAKIQGAFVVIEEVQPKQYKIVEEYPSKDTRVILREFGGGERILTKEEMDALIKEESARIENNTSTLTNPQLSSNSPSLGGILLSSAAGAILGSWIGGKLFNNQNYQNQRSTTYKSPQTYSRSTDSFNKAKATSATSSTSKSSGFFGSSKSSSSSSTFSTGG